MAEQEGVIKYQLDHEAQDLTDGIDLTDLTHWRSELLRLGLVGQDPGRYDGFGFGNLSQRLALGGFLITGSQTGEIRQLGREHYAWVTNAVTAANRITSQGLTKPSSEALTHAAVYDASSEAQFIFHAHSPEIWQAGARLGLPVTANVAYGTPEMAEEVSWLFADSDVATRGLFIMAGHEDGVVAFGATAELAGHRLIEALQAARKVLA